MKVTMCYLLIRTPLFVFCSVDRILSVWVVSTLFLLGRLFPLCFRQTLSRRSGVWPRCSCRRETRTWRDALWRCGGHTGEEVRNTKRVSDLNGSKCDSIVIGMQMILLDLKTLGFDTS
jgi:hypothetical protein